MAEAFAIVGVVQAALALVSYGAKIVKRMDEFKHNVKGLPESFVKIRNQLPLLLSIIDHIQRQASNGELNADTEALLMPVLEGLRKDIIGFDETLLKVLPSPHASNKEKIAKAIRGVGIQKKIDEFRSSIQDYLNTLTAFQHTRHADSFRELMAMIEGRAERPMEPPNYEALVTSVPMPKLDPVWMVKYDLEEDFVGRDGIMSTIEKQLMEGNHRAALAGIGGVGKSRIAIQYSYRHRQLHLDSHIFWVHGGSRSRFESDYRNIARLLDLRDREDPDVDVLRLVTDWLSDERNGPWLMILDNADDRDLWLGSQKKSAQANNALKPLIQHLPRCIEGFLLATTRDRQLGHLLLEKKQQPLPISRLEPKEAQSLLSTKLSDPQLRPEGIEELARELEYLPLAITQAAAYLEQTEISASEYLEMFRAGQSDIPNLLEESIYDPSRDHESSNSVFQTWRLSFEQLTMQSPKAADVLALMAVLDRQAISSELIQVPGGNVLDQKAAIARLKAFSLIQEESSSKSFSIHRLVQLSTQRWLADHGRLPHWQKTAISVVARALPEEVIFDLWALIQNLDSHIHTVLTYKFSEPSPLVERARILHCLGHYSMEQGQPGAALHWLQKSHQLREEHLGSENILTLETFGLVGLVYSKLGKIEEAREVLEKFHDSTNRVLGPRHRLTLKGKSRLAGCCEPEQGKDLALSTLQLVEEEFGPESEDTIRLLTNIAYCCNRLSQWEEAEKFGLRVLSQRMERKGPDHPETLTIMATLAWTYRGQSRFQEAESFDSKALSRRRETLGPEHPKTQMSMATLVKSCGCMGDWERARGLQREILEAKQRKHGAHHHKTKIEEECLELVEAALKDKNNENDAITWLLEGPRRFKKGRKRGPTRESRDVQRSSNNKSSHGYQDLAVLSRSASGVSMPRFMSNELMTPAVSPGTRRQSRTPGPSDPEIQDARSEVTRRLQAVQEAQAELGRWNRDLAQHIEGFARGTNTMRFAEFNILRQDHKEVVHGKLRKAQAEHEAAKERVSSLSNSHINEAGDEKRDGSLLHHPNS